MSDAHFSNLVIGELRISSDYKFLAHFNLIENNFYGIFDVIRCFHRFLIFHQVSGSYFTILNVEPVHKLDKKIVSILHFHILCPINPLVISGFDDDFLQGTVYIFDYVIVLDIVLILLIGDGYFAVLDGIRR